MTLAIIIVGIVLYYMFALNHAKPTQTQSAATAPPKKSEFNGVDLSHVFQWKDEAATAQELLGVPKFLILAMIWQESSGNPNAGGTVGEIGLMQLTPGAVEATSYTLAEVKNDPQVNVMCGATYLRRLYQLMDNNYFDALRAYNAGFSGASQSARAGKVYAQEVTKKWDYLKQV